ncbi:MAG TPA: patatin-like phospholipase family protein [bacterium]|nr:patatin-like phospholipase family protein [bacterium]
MKRALVLSGGGAKGAFQYGALKYIDDHIGSNQSDYRFDIITGVSVGALNGAMVAMDKLDDLGHIWNTITRDQVYKGSLSPLAAAFRVLLGQQSLLNNDPLYKQIEQHISLSEIQSWCDFRIGVVSLTTGEYLALNARNMKTDQDLHKAVLASTAIPVLWPPVESLQTDLPPEVPPDLVDGGVRNITPLGDVIRDDPREIIIINCESDEVQRDPEASKNIVNIAKRVVMELFLNELFLTDVREFLRINSLVKQAESLGYELKKPDGTPYVAYRAHNIQPAENIGETLDFSRATLDAWIEYGYQTANDVFSTDT